MACYELPLTPTLVLSSQPVSQQPSGGTMTRLDRIRNRRRRRAFERNPCNQFSIGRFRIEIRVFHCEI